MQLKVKYNKKEMNKAIKFCKEFPKRMAEFEKSVNYKVAEKALELILDRVGNEYEHYTKSLEIVRIMNTNAYALISNELQIDSNILDAQIDVVYFIGNDSSEYGKFLIENSPFVAGFVTKAPLGIKTVMRRVSMEERAEVYSVNVEKLDLMSKLVSEYNGELLRIEKINVDIYFTMMRLEYGLPGYPYKPHWSAVRSNLQNFISSAVKSGKLFDSGKIEKVPETNEISQKESDKLEDFIKNNS